MRAYCAVGFLPLICIVSGCESSRGNLPGAPDTKVENQQEKILTELISQALATDTIREMREDLPRATRKVIYLIQSPWSMKWPENYRPSITGIDWKVIDRSRETDPRGLVLGIRLERFDLTDPDPNPFRGNVSLAFVPIGTDPQDANGLSMYYRVRLKGDQWTAELLSWENP